MMAVRAAHWRRIGTTVDLLVSNGPVAPAREAVDAVIDGADQAISRFRPDSELSQLNRAEGRGRAVSPFFGRALEAALRGARLSDGLVDPTVGRVLRLAGYDADFEQVRDRDAPAVVRLESVPGWTAIDWNATTRWVQLPPRVELDFGSVGKALIVDLAAAAALETLPEGAGVLVSVGGDMRVFGPPPRSGWRVLMAENSSAPVGTPGELAVVRDGALATSSTTVRRWRRGHTYFHHLIDPRTGRPARGSWRTVSVVAGTCVDANIAATAAIILGDDATAWLEANGLAARLVSRRGVPAYVGGWAGEQRATA
jgi:thiamine biosynthesis lipoprotein